MQPFYKNHPVEGCFKTTNTNMHDSLSIVTFSVLKQPLFSRIYVYFLLKCRSENTPSWKQRYNAHTGNSFQFSVFWICTNIYSVHTENVCIARLVTFIKGLRVIYHLSNFTAKNFHTKFTLRMKIFWQLILFDK